MVVYLDTSSLVKPYVEEKDSVKLSALVRSSKVAATCLVAYAEARAAFTRRCRDRKLSGGVSMSI
jgi:predicted nucleic acid-binding protein